MIDVEQKEKRHKQPRRSRESWEESRIFFDLIDSDYLEALQDYFSDTMDRIHERSRNRLLSIKKNRAFCDVSL